MLALPNVQRRPSATQLPLLVGSIVLAFLAAPWSLEHTAHAALHGLCAQTPSHTLLLGGQRLPFDARMTGIYGGFLVAFALLVSRGRYRAAALPSRPVIALLAMAVLAMAVDGFNSLLRDLMQPHLYEPDNRLRLATGLGAGIALAGALCYLVAISLWRSPDAGARAVRGSDLVLCVVAAVAFAAAVLSGWGALADPLTLLLALAALTAVSAIASVAIVLFRGIDSTFGSFDDATGVATQALLAAVMVIAALSSGRFLLERYAGLQTLP